MFGRKKKPDAPLALQDDPPARASVGLAGPSPVAAEAGLDDVALAEHLDAEGRHEEAIDALRRGWTSGSVEATRRLGERLLIGRDAPAYPQEGASLIGAAAEKGDAEASRILANLAGAGSVSPQSWPTALDHLANAAERGSNHARAQLRLLCGRDGRDWRIMRHEIDLDAWLTAPPRTPICESPRIRIASGVCSPEVCDWLVNAARDGLKPALMYSNALKKPVLADSRRCSEYQFDIIGSDVVVLLVRARIAALTKMPVYAMEPPQVFHYKTGEEIKPHYDLVKGEDEGFGRGAAFSSDRIVSSIVYLNDDYGGGELEFPKVGVKHRGKKGDIIYFANLDNEGKREVNGLHAGRPVTQGEKWVLSQWIHNQPFAASV